MTSNLSFGGVWMSRFFSFPSLCVLQKYKASTPSISEDLDQLFCFWPAWGRIFLVPSTPGCWLVTSIPASWGLFMGRSNRSKAKCEGNQVNRLFFAVESRGTLWDYFINHHTNPYY